MKALLSWLKPCVLRIGNRGSGKTSTGTEPDLILAATEGVYTTLYLDGKGTSARRMAGQLDARGLAGRCRIEIARRTDLVLSWPHRRAALAVDPLERRIEDELADDEFLQPYWSLRGLKSGLLKPYTLKFALLATRLWSRQPELRHLSWVRAALRPGSSECLEMARVTTDQAALEELREAAYRGMRNPVQWEVEAGASYRLLEPADSPALWARHGPDDYWGRALDGRYQTYVDLSGLAPTAQRALAIAAYTGLINAVRRRFARTRRPTPVLIVIEDAGALDLVTPLLLSSMQYDREAGVSVQVVSQTVNDFEPDVFDQLRALCDRHEWYRMNAGVDAVAADLADPTWDRNKVRSTRERQVHDGWDEIQTRQTSEGVSVDHLHRERKDDRVSRGTSYRPRYKTVIDVEYETPQLHLQDFRTSVATLDVFQRYVRDAGGVRKETSEPLGDPWPLGLSEIRTTRAIERIRRQADYRPPWLPPELPPPPPPPPAPPKKPRGRRGKSSDGPAPSAADTFRGSGAGSS